MSHVEPLHPDDIEDYEAFAGVVRSSHPQRFEFTSVGDPTPNGFDEPVAPREAPASCRNPQEFRDLWHVSYWDHLWHSVTDDERPKHGRGGEGAPRCWSRTTTSRS